MRKIIILILLGAAIAAADPFNTVTAYTLPPQIGYIGPNVPVTIPLEEGGDISIAPVLWAGYGIFPRFDMTLMIPASIYEGEFNLGDAMLEWRYELISYEMLSVSPVFDVFIPMYSGGSLSFGPGVMASAGFPALQLHANLFYTTDFKGSAGELAFLTASEYWLYESFSLYTELNLYYSLDAKEGTVEFWPGVSWYPTNWLNINAALGIPTTLGYLSPGLAAYVSF
ncbi:hypothetical protein CEE36_01710 [candidate division TA06 bacterium B3_TA06]|uniref:Outer membrane protein beta-barrel domain-containing protein n=1 Tax=candidate division TA06 bacterium B3_TA06 TaxID=2012487 RepID=A0A532V9K8_UNCT6|nr:MAG: hypothetical protein CEE36_01710 [candidate division TA06 bacterium B3_TA06]